MSDYPMLISNKLHSFRNFVIQKDNRKGSVFAIRRRMLEEENAAKGGKSLRKLGGGAKSLRPWTMPPSAYVSCVLI